MGSYFWGWCGDGLGELWCGVKGFIVLVGFIVDFVFIVYFMYNCVFFFGKVWSDSAV